MGRYPEEHHGPYPLERWEPRSPEQWARQDPFREVDLPIEQRYPEQAQVAVFEAWNHLPTPLRRQVWFEREVAAGLYARSRDWKRIPGIRFLSVGNRGEGARRRRVGIVSIEPTLGEDRMPTHESLGIPESIRIRSRVNEDVFVPVWIEHQLPAEMLSHAFVPPGQFIAASNVSPLSGPVPTVQSGDVIAGESPAGFRTPGTLTAVVSRVNNNALLLLCAAHVLGKSRWKVVANVPVPAEVGNVIEIDQDLDAGLAELKPPWKVDFRLKAVPMVPAAPVMPYTDMPVQFYGGASGHQRGWINTVNSIPVGGKLVGIIPHFTVSIPSKPGDSGALLISGHGTDNPFPTAYAGQMGPQYLEAMTCAMLGMIVAGPSSTISPATRPQTYVTPILSVLNHFRLRAWVRSM